MRLLMVIPHYFRREGESSDLERRHASTSGAVETRAAAIRKTVMSLHQSFGPSQAIIRHADRRTEAANTQLRNDVHLVVVTAGGSHVLSDAKIPTSLFHHLSVDDNPKFLGFHCHNVLRDRWGNYDYFGYLEDDLSIYDAWFFEKLRWFNSHVGHENVLLPNRFELAEELAYKKCYIDGDLAQRVTSPFQDISEMPELKSTVLGKPIRLVRPLNPHSGCFFLNRDQMKMWMEQPHFGKRETDFIGPLESAATLGIMKTFKIYKPAPENASFLEIQHDGCAFTRLVRKAES